MQFQVPQFIEVEDKIFGPLTWKQFIYLAGGGGMIAVIFYFLPKIIAIPLAIPIAIFALALAFYRLNNRPFINVVESALKYYFGSKLYIWRRKEKPVIEKDMAPKGEESAQIYVPKLSDSKLKDLNWMLDTQKKESE